MYHLEYIWIGGNEELRSKSKLMKEVDLDNLPEWNFDGSSTHQAFDVDTEVCLKPVKVVRSPFLLQHCTSYLVLCETFRGNQFSTRTDAKALFDVNPAQKPWFGLEQEYFMVGEHMPHNQTTQGSYYCGVGKKHPHERKIALEHLEACLYAGLDISGINAEVAHGQWEYQIGPCVGIDASDQLWLSRYILERVAEQYHVNIVYDPKPFGQVNGSGCHVNFSTEDMRQEDGLSNIEACIHRLADHHQEVIAVSGKNNHLRLTGIHETSSMDVFTWGIGTRHTSIRIPNGVFQAKQGYFEDRRFASNVNPYLATSLLFKICCI